MRRWLIPAILVVVAGISLWVAQPQPDRPSAVGVTPVPRDQGNWEASHSDPAIAARQFAFAGETCDCERFVVRLLNLHDDGTITYAVRLEGLKDDSIDTIQYTVTLKRAGEMWHVDTATYRTTCRRGADQNGYCI